MTKRIAVALAVPAVLRAGIGAGSAHWTQILAKVNRLNASVH
jgi:hypothetical protein